MTRPTRSLLTTTYAITVYDSESGNFLLSSDADVAMVAWQAPNPYERVRAGGGKALAR